MRMAKIPLEVVVDFSDYIAEALAANVPFSSATAWYRLHLYVVDGGYNKVFLRRRCHPLVRRTSPS